jgi:hypothetical protein
VPDITAGGTAPATLIAGVYTNGFTIVSSNIATSVEADAGPHDFQVWLSSNNNTLDPQVDLLLYSTGIPALMPLSSHTQNYGITIPSGVTGNAWLILFSESSLIMQERSELNNIYVIPVVIQSCSLLATETHTSDNCQPLSGDISLAVSGNSGTASYTWNNPIYNGLSVLSGLGNGYYEVLVGDGLGCEQILSVFFYDIPTLPLGASWNLNSSHTVAYINGTGGTAPYTYAWSPGGLATSSIPVVQGNTYECTITDANNCSFVLNTGPIQRLTTNTDETNNNLNNISIYPNPTDGILIIVSPNGINSVKVFTERGSLYNSIIPQNVGNNRYEVLLEDLVPGIYDIRIETNDGDFTMYRLVKL